MYAIDAIDTTDATGAKEAEDYKGNGNMGYTVGMVSLGCFSLVVRSNGEVRE